MGESSVGLEEKWGWGCSSRQKTVVVTTVTPRSGAVDDTPELSVSATSVEEETLEKERWKNME